MRYLILAFAIAAVSCESKVKQVEQKEPVLLTKIDTVYLPSYDSTESELVPYNDSVYFIPSCDSFKVALMLERYKLARVKYYLSIVDRNPSQLKFLRSWIRRAIE